MKTTDIPATLIERARTIIDRVKPATDFLDHAEIARMGASLGGDPALKSARAYLASWTFVDRKDSSLLISDNDTVPDAISILCDAYDADPRYGYKLADALALILRAS